MSQHDWDARYQASSRVFSGRPNPTLVTETANLPPGRALDIGCGEGADAIWLAEHGWEVTAIDTAPTALHRAAQTNPDLARGVTWVESDITHDPPPGGPFDLVTMHYVPLSKAELNRILPRLLETVAPDGALLFVTHDIRDLDARPGFDPHHYCQPEDIAQRLGPYWEIFVNERRRREQKAPAGTSHTHDVVLHARHVHAESETDHE